MATPVITWEHHRFYADDNATLNSCTALAAQDAVLDRQTGTTNRFIVRLGVSNSSAANFNETIAFEYELNDSGSWVQIDTTTAGRCVATTAGLATEGDSVGATGVLTGMTESVYDVSGQFDDNDGVTGSVAVTKSNWAECAVCCYIVDANVSDNDSIKIRCNAAGGTESWATYGEANVTVDKAAAQHTITGAVAVGSAVAAAMVYNFVRAIAGAVTIGSTVTASAMSYNEHHLLSGDVTVGSAVVAAMDYTQNASIAGDVTVSSAVAAGMDYTLNADITGNVTVVSVVAASEMTYSAGAAEHLITGDVQVATTPTASALLYNQHPSIAGDVSVGSNVGAAMTFNQHPSVSGDVTVGSAVAAGMDYTLNAAIAGDVAVGSAVASAMAYSASGASEYLITGSVPVVTVPTASGLVYNQNPSFAGDTTVIVAVAADLDSEIHPAFVGDTSVAGSVAAVFVHNIHPAVVGDVSSTVALSSAFERNTHPNILGEVTVVSVVEAGLAYTPFSEEVLLPTTTALPTLVWGNSWCWARGRGS